MSAAVTRGPRDQRGFTVAEVLVAAAVIMLAFVALATIVPIASYGVQEGNQLSTATFLAEQKLEQIKNLPWVSTPENDCLGFSPLGVGVPRVPVGKTCTLGATTVSGGNVLPWLADEATITGFPVYSRIVRVTQCTTSPCAGVTDPSGRIRLVTVSVTYTPLSASAQAAATPKTIQIQMVVAQR